MKRTIAALVLALAAPLGGAIPAAQAHDGTRAPCVGPHEYRHILNGYHTKGEIERMLDTRGRRISRNGAIIAKEYPWCPRGRWHAAQVFYVRMDDGTLLAFEKQRY